MAKIVAAPIRKFSKKDLIGASSALTEKVSDLSMRMQSLFNKYEEKWSRLNSLYSGVSSLRFEILTGKLNKDSVHSATKRVDNITSGANSLRFSVDIYPAVFKLLCEEVNELKFEIDQFQQMISEVCYVIDPDEIHSDEQIKNIMDQQKLIIAEHKNQMLFLNEIDKKHNNFSAELKRVEDAIPKIKTQIESHSKIISLCAVNTLMHASLDDQSSNKVTSKLYRSKNS